MPEQVDYVEGFMVLNERALHSSSIAFPAQLNFSPDFGSMGRKKVYYCIEFAVHDSQKDSSNAEHAMELVSEKLSYLRPHMYSVDVSYFDFLNRVRMEEESLRSRGLWDVPHPWLNVFVPKHGITRFKDLLMDAISADDFEGPILVYPLLADKWDRNTSAVVPATPDGVMYIFGVLRSTDPARCGRACVESSRRRRAGATTSAPAGAGSRPARPGSTRCTCSARARAFSQGRIPRGGAMRCDGDAAGAGDGANRWSRLLPLT
uniref:Cytokinin dehydrogenase 1 FAD/cytokinin binding domain-containing protein n=1 Tax=Oryza brachyantha TaxID=4533 RepID=J3LZP2_ORYBR